MPNASNILTVILDALFAIINIALSVILSYVGTLAMAAGAVLALFAAGFGLFAVVRAVRRRSHDPITASKTKAPPLRQRPRL